MFLPEMVWDFFVIDLFHRCSDEYFLVMSDMFPAPIYITGDNDNEPDKGVVA